MRRLILAVIAGLVPAAASAASSCPCYTLSSSYNTYNCGVEAVAGTNPNPAQWQDLFSVVSQGAAGWGSNGPSVGTIGEGCGKPEIEQQVPARFPCELLKAIAMQESSWRQFCVATTPSDQTSGTSRTIISFDCGYGVSQVTSGMHIGESPSYDRLRVASDPLYNLATGASILAGKWRVTACVGDNQPAIIEHWYSATWAYNGLSWKNNPNNPSYSANRSAWIPSIGNPAPYQEKVFGWMEYPPSPAAQYWTSVAVAYPKLSDIPSAVDSGVPTAMPDPTCASPTSCVNTRSLHVSSCFGATTDAGVVDAGVADAGVDAGAPDSGAVDAGTADAGEPDAGPPVIDAGGVEPDAGGTPFEPWVQPLAATSARPLATEQGCGCGAAAGASAGAVWLTFAFVLSARRRRSS